MPGMTNSISTRVAVLGSNGSVLPLFQEQIVAGGPITLTDKSLYDGSRAKKIKIPNLPTKEKA